MIVTSGGREKMKKCKICGKPLSNNTKHIKLSKSNQHNENLFGICMCDKCTAILVEALEKRSEEE